VELPYTLLDLAQGIGRCARHPGQVGTAYLVDSSRGPQDFKEHEAQQLEVYRLLSSTSCLVDQLSVYLDNATLTCNQLAPEVQCSSCTPAPIPLATEEEEISQEMLKLLMTPPGMSAAESQEPSRQSAQTQRAASFSRPPPISAPLNISARRPRLAVTVQPRPRLAVTVQPLGLVAVAQPKMRNNSIMWRESRQSLTRLPL